MANTPPISNEEIKRRFFYDLEINGSIKYVGEYINSQAELSKLREREAVDGMRWILGVG